MSSKWFNTDLNTFKNGFKLGRTGFIQVERGLIWTLRSIEWFITGYYWSNSDFNQLKGFYLASNWSWTSLKWFNLFFKLVIDGSRLPLVIVRFRWTLRGLKRAEPSVTLVCTVPF